MFCGLDQWGNYTAARISGMQLASKNFALNCINAASNIIRHETGRFFFPTDDTSILDGPGSAVLSLLNYPTLSTSASIDIRIDPARLFPIGTKIASANITVDQDSGVVYGILTDLFTAGERNIQVQAWYGWQNFTVIAGVNDKIYFTESGGAAINITIPAGDYTADNLCAAIQTQLTLVGALVYIVSYTDRRFRILASDNVKFDWRITGANNAADLLGFEFAESNNIPSHVADYVRSGLPDDIQFAAIEFSTALYYNAKSGEGRLNMARVQQDHDGLKNTVLQYRDLLPESVKFIINKYKFDKKRRNAGI